MEGTWETILSGFARLRSSWCLLLCIRVIRLILSARILSTLLSFRLLPRRHARYKRHILVRWAVNLERFWSDSCLRWRGLTLSGKAVRAVKLHNVGVIRLTPATLYQTSKLIWSRHPVWPYCRTCEPHFPAATHDKTGLSVQIWSECRSSNAKHRPLWVSRPHRYTS